MSKFDYADPGTDPAYCNAISTPPPFHCAWCNNIEEDETYWPYCSQTCVDAAAVADENEAAAAQAREMKPFRKGAA